MDYTDSQFLEAFESGTIESFRHRDHIRLAMLYIQRYGMPEAEAQIAEAIRQFAAKAGQSEKYHHTITIAWVRLTARLLDKNLLSTYYSGERLGSAEARNAFLEPDLRPLG